MIIKEIEQLIKDIPEELFEIPQYDKLIRTVSTVSTYGSPYVVLQITTSSITGSIPIAQFSIFSNMKFVFKLYLNDRYRLMSYLKTQIPNVLNQIKSYLSILGFKEVGLEGFINQYGR